ncbi:hypothetical protein RM549_18985 [Salegentibacter sp. F188]|uniref:CYTH domain-containing protein n=1 Tax=Autumnicola patrickiae TaxID=3075591 RepID=A0ABU3E7G0_9FLAO|nr:hypothetical protein [Salegentibacter sp. F188]MDT0691885.1 hypothetical protein [Salegentibacter sp. F188]
MQFKSSEIRWFSREKQVLWDIFESLEMLGPGDPEEERTDYYLNSDTPNSGIKIRDGKHELKVKISQDEKLGYGILQHWSKWSYSEEENILNSVNSDLLIDWLKMTKNRAKKSYKITAEKKVEFTSEENIEEGFDVEFTRFEIPSLEITGFTLGLEAFSGKNNSEENLYLALRALQLKTSHLKNLKSCSYPEFLNDLFSEGR